jgi:bacterioferritin (cytochrome b1)
MPKIKQELIQMLNRALELEHAARIQYLTHAELIKGLGAEKVILAVSPLWALLRHTRQMMQREFWR